MRRYWPFGLGLIWAIVLLYAALARLAPAQNLNANSGYAYTIPVDPRARWSVLFNSSTSDGAGTAIADPFGMTGFSSAAASYLTGGRLILNNGDGKSRVELLPLFSAAAATAEVQVFQFDWWRSSDVSGVTLDRNIAPTGDSTLCLGLPYPLAQDGAARTFSLSATVDTFKCAVSANSAGWRVIYPQNSGGTTYYVGQRLIFDLAGGFAYFPYVVSISSGTLILLVRVI